ncbi:MAG TPA: hypothetical protein VFJ11_07095 [Gaiellaceae bacterium]|nr:hypothetical protein [Gaiellaceae bacterium]
MLLFVLVPEPKQPDAAATGRPGSAKLAQPVNLRVPLAQRRAVNKVLDRFIPAGVGRRSMTTAWRLAAPELKAASTLRQWRNDVSPIPYYPVAGKTFHNWETLDAGPNFVEFALLVVPVRSSHLDAWALFGVVVRRGSRWLVDRLYPAATYNRAGVLTGPADLVAGHVRSGGPASKAVLGRGWLLGIVCTIVLLFLFAPAFLFASSLRNRRMWRHRNQPLPPLPTRVLSRRG